MALLEKHKTQFVFQVAGCETCGRLAEREIAVVPMVAKWGAAFLISEHEWIAEGTSGYSKAAIPADKVERMIVGLPVSFEDSRQQIVYEVATALIDSRYVPKGLYDRAVKELGNNGVTDLAIIMGYFSMVSFTAEALAIHTGYTVKGAIG